MFLFGAGPAPCVRTRAEKGVSVAVFAHLQFILLFSILSIHYLRRSFYLFIGETGLMGEKMHKVVLETLCFYEKTEQCWA